MKKLFFIGFLLTGLAITGLKAQQIPVASSLPDVISGQPFSFAQHKNTRALVIVFTSSYCPYSRLYEARIKQLVQDFQSKGVNFVFVNPNNPNEQSEDSDESMRNKMREWNLNLPYLRDQKQQLARSLKASKTPEVFVLKPAGNNFSVVYSGAIDDNPQVATDVGHNYLKNALESMVSGAPVPTAHQRPVGCMIKMD